MQSYLFGDALAGILRNAEFDFDVYKAEKPEDVVDMSRYLLPYAVLMEVTSFGPRLLDERMPAHTPNPRLNASSTMKLPINPLAPVIKIDSTSSVTNY